MFVGLFVFVLVFLTLLCVIFESKQEEKKRLEVKKDFKNINLIMEFIMNLNLYYMFIFGYILLNYIINSNYWMYNGLFNNN